MARAHTLSKTHAQGRKTATQKETPEARAFLTGKNLYAALSVLLGAVTIALYSPVIRYSFIVTDDRDYVTANPHIRGGLSWSTIQWAFSSTEAANWHPLTWLSHAVDYQLFGLSAAGHHFDSVLIHALNAVILFLLLVWVTKRMGPSLLVAALFAVHPLNVESVAWVAERKNVLSMMFFLLTLCAYVWYARGPSLRRYAAVVAMFALALLAKPQVVTLPFLLLLLDYWPLGRIAYAHQPAPFTSNLNLPKLPVGQLIWEKLPLLLLAAASAVVTMVAQKAGGAVKDFAHYGLFLRLENALVAYVRYLGKAIWPSNLEVLYPHPTTLYPAWQVGAAAVLLLLITAWVLRARQQRYLAVGWFWYLGTLVPMIGLVQVGNQAIADRYAYLPLIGIFVMIVWGLDDWAESRKVRAVWLAVPALGVLTAFSFVTHRQIGYWDSEYDLWAHALAIDEKNSFAHDSLAAAFILPPTSTMTLHNLEIFDTPQKRIEQARLHYEEALEIRRALLQESPATYLQEIGPTLNNLGNLYLNQNRIDQALPHYEEALQIYRKLAQENPAAYLPDVASALNNLGNLYLRQNRMTEARERYDEGLQIRRALAQHDPFAQLPAIAAILHNLGDVAGVENRTAEAPQEHEEALEIKSTLTLESPGSYVRDLAKALTSMGNLELQQNRVSPARRYFESAVEIYRELAQQDPAAYLPDVAATLNIMGNLNRIENRLPESQQQYEEALKIQRQLVQENLEQYLPDLAKTLNEFGLLDVTQNRIDDARQLYEEALTIQSQLAKEDPGTYLPDAFTTLNNLGNLDLAQNRLDQARQHYEGALKIQSQLEQQNPGEFQPGMAMALANLGNLDWQQNRMEEARGHFEEAMKIYRQLVRQNPGAYLPNMVTTLNNMGNMDRQQNRMGDARECYEQALDLYRQLARQDPVKYFPYLAWALQNLGNLDRSQNRMGEARVHYREALALFQKLVQSGGQYSGDLATTEASLKALGGSQAKSQE